MFPIDLEPEEIDIELPGLRDIVDAQDRDGGVERDLVHGPSRRERGRYGAGRGGCNT